MKFLITGASGFLGGRLSNFLEQKGFETIKGSRNLRLVESSKNYNWVLTEFNNYDSLKKICEGVDFIIHAAGPNSKECIRNPLSSFDFYRSQTKNFVNAAKASKVKKFIFLSTAHVYGDQFEGLINEKSPTLNNHPYALANLEGERTVRKIFGHNPNDCIILRLSNIFGFPSRKEVNCWMLFINNICKEIVQNQTITIKSNPLIKRDFLPIMDFCEIILKLCNANLKDNQDNIINFGSGRAISLIDSAKIIKDIYCFKYGKEVEFIIKEDMKSTSDFKFCIQILEENNLNIKFKNSMQIEINNLLEKCNEYFVC